MELYYNPVDKSCKSQTGAVFAGQKVKFCVFGDFLSARIIITADNGYCLDRQMERLGGGFSCEVVFECSGLYKYYFVIDRKTFGRGDFQRAAPSGKPFLQTVCPIDFIPPERFKGKVIYQIFPDRFCRKGNRLPTYNRIFRDDWGGVPEYLPNDSGKILNNDFFGGDLEGIISKLDYLADLGVGIIYLNPIFEAYSNHRYDTGDYFKIDGLLGSLQHFERLIFEAKKRDIDIFIDGVFNHTGDDSVYFNRFGRYDGLGAFQSTQSKYYDWYNFTRWPLEYECWWGIKILPQVNEHDPSYRNFITGDGGVISYWLNKGVAGIRLDVADELPDDFLTEIRRAVRREGDNLIISEVWEDASDKFSYGARKKYFDGALTDSVTNYPLKDAIITSVQSGCVYDFVRAVNLLKDHYPKGVLDNLMNMLGNHDTERILTVLSGVRLKSKTEQSVYKMPQNLRENAKKLLKFAQILQFTVFGLPCIYYGDEAGAEGFNDPFNRTCFPWGGEDKELTAWVKKLCNLRKIPEFKEGELNILYYDYGAVVFERRTGARAVTVALNLGASGYDLKFSGTMYELLSGERLSGGYYLQPYSAAVIYDCPL